MDNVDILNEFMKASSDLYTHLVTKAVNGASLSDNEFLFLKEHERRLLNYYKDKKETSENE